MAPTQSRLVSGCSAKVMTAYRCQRLDVPCQRLRNILEVTPWFFHIETLAKAEVPKNIKYQVRRLRRHVDWTNPVTILLVVLTEEFDPSIYIAMNEGFCGACSRLGEGVIQHSSFTSVNLVGCRIPGIQCIDGASPYDIRVAFSYVSPMAIDLPLPVWRIDADGIGLVSKLRTCRYEQNVQKQSLLGEPSTDHTALVN